MLQNSHGPIGHYSISLQFTPIFHDERHECCNVVVKAYQYSSITSMTLLDCWTIPWVMILSWFILRPHYSSWQYLGSAICVIGLVLVLLSDTGASSGGKGFVSLRVSYNKTLEMSPFVLQSFYIWWKRSHQTPNNIRTCLSPNLKELRNSGLDLKIITYVVLIISVRTLPCRWEESCLG